MIPISIDGQRSSIVAAGDLPTALAYADQMVE